MGMGAAPWRWGWGLHQVMGRGAAPQHPDTEPMLPPASTPAGSLCHRPVTAPWPWTGAAPWQWGWGLPQVMGTGGPQVMGRGAAPQHPNIKSTLPLTPAGSLCRRPATAPWPWMRTLGPWGRHCCLPCLYPWPGPSQGLPGHPCLAGGFGGGSSPQTGLPGQRGDSEAPQRWEPQGGWGHPGSHFRTPAPFLRLVPAAAAQGKGPHTAGGVTGSPVPGVGAGPGGGRHPEPQPRAEGQPGKTVRPVPPS